VPTVRKPRLGNGATGADHMALRRHNLAVVLDFLRATEGASRARVAVETGLNKATVSSLVTELIDRGLIEEAESVRGGIGRPGQILRLDGGRLCGLGAEISVDYLALMALAVNGDVLAETRLPLDAVAMGARGVLDVLGNMLVSALAELAGAGVHVAGLTVAVPGLVKVEPGVIAVAPNLGWRDIAVIDEIRARLGRAEFPIRVDNEANLAASACYAEVLAGAHPDVTDIVSLSGGAGVGGGVVSDGRLLRGGRGFGGEVGHIPIGPADRVCGCGRTGCWESVVGLDSLFDAAAAPDDPVRDRSLDLVARLDSLTARAQAGDPRTLTALAEVGTWLGRGAAVLINILNPDVLVLGGYFAPVSPWLLPLVDRELDEHVMAPETGGCQVVVSGLGFAAAVRGGAQTSLEAVFADPTLIDLGPARELARKGATS